MAHEHNVIANAAPHRATDGFRRLTTSAVDASITLAPGIYEVTNASTIDVIIKHGAAATLPASGDPEVLGVQVIPAGAVGPVEIGPSATALHAALVSAGAGELYLRRVVL